MTLGDLAIDPVRVFDDAVPTVVVGHVAGGAPLGNALAMPAMVVRVRRVPGSSECLRKTRIAGPVFRHPVQHLNDRLGFLHGPAAHLKIRPVHRLKRKIH